MPSRSLGHRLPSRWAIWRNNQSRSFSGKCGKHRPAHSRGRDRDARSEIEAQHDRGFCAAVFYIQQVKSIAAAERDRSPGIIRQCLHMRARDLADTHIGKRRIPIAKAPGASWYFCSRSRCVR